MKISESSDVNTFEQPYVVFCRQGCSDFYIYGIQSNIIWPGVFVLFGTVLWNCAI